MLRTVLSRAAARLAVPRRGFGAPAGPGSEGIVFIISFGPTIASLDTHTCAPASPAYLFGIKPGTYVNEGWEVWTAWPLMRITEIQKGAKTNALGYFMAHK